MRLRVRIEVIALVAALGSLLLSGWSLWQSNRALDLSRLEVSVAQFAPAAFEITEDCRATLVAWPESAVLLDLKLYQADDETSYNFISQKTDILNLTYVALGDSGRRFGRELPSRQAIAGSRRNEWMLETYEATPLVASYTVELGGRYVEYHALLWLVVGYEFENNDQTRPIAYFCRSLSSGGYFASREEAHQEARRTVGRNREQ